MPRIKTLAAAFLLLIGTLLLGACEKQSGAFAVLDLDEAKQRASDDGKFVLIDFTATWCGPCKQMDVDTWSDAAVVDWIDEHAIAVQIDVDQKSDIAKQYNVNAMPTIVLERDGVVIDRIVGYRGPDEFITWLDNARQGKTALDTARAKVGDRPAPGEPADMQARYMFANQLVGAGKLDEATDEFVWLWQHMLEHQSAMYGVRLSYMVNDMRELAAQHEPAKQAFTRLRDELTPSVHDGTADREQAVDWAHLSLVINDEDALVNWFDDARSDPDQLALLQLLADYMFEFLAERDRLADAIVLYPDPVQKARQTVRLLEESISDFQRRSDDLPDGVDAQQLLGMLRQSRNEDVAQLYALCLAADHEDQASEIADILLDLEDNESAALTLTEYALAADEPRPEHLQWLRDAPPSPQRAALIDELNQRLKTTDASP